MVIEIAEDATRTDFINHLYRLIGDLDKRIFAKPANVLVTKGIYYQDYAIAGFVPKRPLFSLLGLRDNYFIFEESKDFKKIQTNDEKILIEIAAHEVRHRFQHYNKENYISFNFIKQSKLLRKSVVEKIYEQLYNLYRKDQELIKKEFDASIIGIVISGLCHIPGFSMETIVELIKCNEGNINEILLKLRRQILS